MSIPEQRDTRKVDRPVITLHHSDPYGSKRPRRIPNGTVGRSAQRSKEGRRQGFAEHCSALPQPACHAGQTVGEDAGMAPTEDMSVGERPALPFPQQT